MRTLVMTLLLALPLQLVAQGAQQSLSQTAIQNGDGAGAQKQPASTWFGMGYESRLDEEDRDMFESNASRSSVFSSGAGAFTTPSSAGRGRSGGR